MDLQQKQKRYILKKIINNELKGGVVPEEDKLQNLLMYFFKDKLPGLPTADFKKATSRETYDTEKLNKTFNEIGLDLNVLYDAVKDNNKSVIDRFIYLESEKSKIDKKLNRLLKKSEELIELAKNDTNYGFTFREGFNNLKNINLNRTTADINLENGSVVLPSQKRGSFKHSLQEASIKISDKSENIKNSERLSDLKNAINDFKNKVWIERLKSDNDETYIELEVSLDKDTKFNGIALNSASPYESKVEIKYYSDNKWNKIDLDENNLTDNKLWYFAPKESNKIKIKLSKQSPDVSDKREGKLSIYGLKNISIFNTKFKKKARLSLGEIEFADDRFFNKINIETDSVNHSYTNLNYYIKLLGSGQDSKFYEVDEGGTLNLDNIVQEKTGMNEGDIIGNFDYMNSTFYRYDLGLYNNSYNDIEVYKGIGRWRREVYRKNYIDNHKSTINDWLSLPVKKSNENIYKKDYVENITKNDNFDANPKQTNYKFTTHIYSEENMSYSGGLIDIKESLNNPKEHRFASLYVNGNRVYKKFEDNYKYRYQFILKEGWNKVEYIFRKTSDNNFVVPFYEITSEESIPNKRSRKKPMKQVSGFELKNNIPPTDDDCYALIDDMVVLNTNRDNEYSVGIKKNTSFYDRFLLEAELNSEDSRYTPELNEVQVNAYQ